jgi:hypothetical protein
MRAQTIELERIVDWNAFEPALETRIGPQLCEVTPLQKQGGTT